MLVSIFCFCHPRGFKDLELDTPSIEKRFAYSFLQQLIRYVDEAHQYILEFGRYHGPAINSPVFVTFVTYNIRI